MSQALIIDGFLRKNNGNEGLKFSFEYELQQRKQYLISGWFFDKLLLELLT